jgi:carbon storage regulator
VLVLTRKVGERIVIDDTIVIEVLEAQTGRIRVGIQAPPDVKILRHELIARDHARLPENQASSDSRGDR